jgi:hypothetical protein
MDADFSIELSQEDPVLDFPWKDPAGRLIYVNLKRHPELLPQVEEAVKFPALGEFLRTLNSPRSVLETAKCDAWATTDINAEEEIYNASHKFVSYVDAVFSGIDVPKLSLQEALAVHEKFAGKLVDLLRRTPETPSSAELCIRRCYYIEDSGVREGLYFTLYVSGYGDEPASALQNWAVALKLTGNAIVQVSVSQT